MVGIPPDWRNPYNLGVPGSVVIFFMARSVLPCIDTIKTEKQWVTPGTPEPPAARRNLPIGKIRTRRNQGN